MLQIFQMIMVFSVEGSSWSYATRLILFQIGNILEYWKKKETMLCGFCYFKMFNLLPDT